MKLEIYSQNEELKAAVEPSENSTQSEGVMQESALNLSFVLADYVHLDVNDYIDYRQKRYSLFDEYRPEQVSTQEYKYDLHFYGPEKWLERALVLKLVDSEDEPVFALTDTPRAHLQLYVDNLNRIYGRNVWSVGEVVETENITIEYNKTHCKAAITDLADKTGTEYWVEGFTLNLSRCEHGEQLALGYGQGLLNLARDKNEKAPFFTRLYPIGSTRNIDRQDYGASRLQLPDGVKYVEHNTQYGIFEQSEENAFSHIYPRRVGRVKTVRSEERTVDGQQMTVYYFKDTELPFDPNEYEIAGLVKQISFQSGVMNGYTFEANFDSETREFELITQFPYENMQLPGGSMVPEPEDEYVLWNIRMPQQYYTLAEQEYLAAVQDFIGLYSIDTAVYKGKTNYLDLDRRGIELVLGRRVLLESAEYFSEDSRSSRITSITRKIDRPNDADIECTHTVTASRIAAIENQVLQMQAAISEQLDRTDLQVLKSWDSADMTEYNVFSALRALREIAARALSRQQADQAQGVITFLAGLVSNGALKAKLGAEFGEYITGMLGGRGAALSIDPATGKSTLEIDKIHAREELIVPKITFNCTDIVSGDRASTFAFGTILSVDTENHIATLDLLDDQLGTLKTNDICRGVFHRLDGGNQTEDSVDDNGFLNYAGYSTAYFTPTEVLENAPGVLRFRYALQPDTTVHPVAGMNFFAYGSFTDTERQAMTYETRYYARRLKDVNTWVIDPTRNISMQDGLLEGLTIGGMEMHGYGTFQENTYLTGAHIQFTPSQIEELRGLSAYSVSLSSYEQVIRADDQTAPSTLIQVFRGDTALAYATGVDKDKYVVTMTPVGCTASISSAGLLTITAITDPDNCRVDLKINCEGNAVFDKRFAVVVVRDGEDGTGTPGQDGGVPSIVYKASATKPATPTGTSPVPSGWSADPPVAGDKIVPIYSGDAWTDVAVDGVTFKKSITIGHSQITKQRVTFTTAAAGAVISFDIRTYSEAGYDFMLVGLLDNPNVTRTENYTDRTSGRTGQKIVEVVVPTPGEHFIELAYAKDNMISEPDEYGMYRIIGEDPIWMSTAIVTDGAAGAWSSPVRISGYDGKDGTNGTGTPGKDGGTASLVYKESATQPATPTGTSPVPDGWSANPPSDNTHPIWMSSTIVTDGVAGTWTTPVRVSGIDGEDGEGTPGKDGKKTELRYRDAFTRPATPVGLNPAGWSLSPNPDNPTLTQTGNFTQSGGWWASPATTAHNATYKQRVSFTTVQDNQVLQLELAVSSEAAYDYGIVTRLDEAYATGGTYLWRKAGVVTEVIEVVVPVAGSHFIEIAYTKDGSTSSNEDRLRYRFVTARRRWMSTAEIDPNTSTTTGWSVPVEFPVDSPGEEQIYIRLKSEMSAGLPESDPRADEYIGTALAYVSTVNYIPGNIVAYNTGHRACVVACRGIAPSNDDYWEDCGWWTDDPSGVSEAFPYEYTSVRRFSGGQWGAYEKYRLFLHYTRDGIDGVTPLVTQLVPSVTQIGRTMAGSYEPSSFTVVHKDTAGEPVAAYMAVWGSQDGATYTRIGTVERVSTKVISVASYPFKYFVIRTYATSTATWSSEYLLSASVSVLADGTKGDTGATGPLPVYCGFYEGGKQYTYTDVSRDIINYEIGGAVHTFQVKVHGSTVTTPPSSATGDDNWELANKYSFVAADTALIDGANLAGFMYKSLLMVSRKGTLDGVETDITDAIAAGRLGDFRPHIQMDGNTGEAIFNKVLVRGGLLEPFERYVNADEWRAGLSWNWIIAPEMVISGSLGLPNDKSYEGRTVRILNTKTTDIRISGPVYYNDGQSGLPGVSEPYGTHRISIPPRAMFEAKAILVKGYLSGEYDSVAWLLTCRYEFFLGGDPAFVVKKFVEEPEPEVVDTSQIHTKLLAVGRVTGTSSSASMPFYRTFDSSSLSVSRLATGRYRITVPSAWGVSLSTHLVRLAGYGYVNSGTSNPIKASLISVSSPYITVELSDDDTSNEGSFTFEVVKME